MSKIIKINSDDTNRDFDIGDVIKDCDGTFLICKVGWSKRICLLNLSKLMMLEHTYDSIDDLQRYPANQHLIKVDNIKFEL